MDFIRSPERFTAFIGGIGSGKTWAGCCKALYWASKGGLGLIVAPTYPMLRDATVRTFTDVAGDALTGFQRSDMTAKIRGGGEILFRSADNPDRLRGPNLHWAYIDEAALCPPETWEITIGRLRADGKAGACWLTTTPKGRNWLYNLQAQLTIFRARTQDNPYLDREFVESLETSYTGQFARQELGGEFVTYEGLVYEEFDRERHVRQNPGPFRRYIAGCDEGYTNPAVILVVGFDSDNRAHVVDEFYQRRALQGEVVAEAKRMHRQYRLDMLVVDPSAAGLIAEMRSERLPVAEANNAVMPGIQAVKSLLTRQGDGLPRLTIDPTCVNTIAEAESYVWRGGRQGIKDEPEKVNDHAMDALRYVIMETRRVRGIGFG